VPLSPPFLSTCPSLVHVTLSEGYCRLHQQPVSFLLLTFFPPALCVPCPEFCLPRIPLFLSPKSDPGKAPFRTDQELAWPIPGARCPPPPWHRRVNPVPVGHSVLGDGGPSGFSSLSPSTPVRSFGTALPSHSEGCGELSGTARCYPFVLSLGKP